MSLTHPLPVAFTAVREDEIKYIEAFRQARGLSAENVDANLVGLALSGGGIRSASFQLGILQALSRAGTIRYVDYISAVSGGAYTASWFVKCVSKLTYVKTIDLLRSDSGAANDEISWLRRHTSFLTPRLGIFSHDLLLFATIYFHNLVVNTLVLSLLCASTLGLPRLLLSFFALVPGGSSQSSMWTALMALCGGTLAAASMLVVIHELFTNTPRVADKPYSYRLFSFIAVFSIMLLFASPNRGGLIDSATAGISLLWFFYYFSDSHLLPNYVNAVALFFIIAMCFFIVAVRIFPYCAASAALAGPLAAGVIKFWSDHKTEDLIAEEDYRRHLDCIWISNLRLDISSGGFDSAARQANHFLCPLVSGS